MRVVWLPSEIILPLGDLLQPSEQEYTFTLRFPHRFHNPDSIGVSFKFLNKQRVLSGHVISNREEIHICSLFISSFFLKLAFVAFEILDHEILATQLAVVSKVIDSLMRLEVNVIKYFMNPLLVRPDDVPVQITN